VRAVPAVPRRRLLNILATAQIARTAKDDLNPMLNPVDAGSLADAEPVGDQAAEECRDDASADRRPRRNVLPTREQELAQVAEHDTHDQCPHNRPDHVSNPLSIIVAVVYR
jgi:hypothetical protein